MKGNTFTQLVMKFFLTYYFHNRLIQNQIYISRKRLEGVKIGNIGADLYRWNKTL